MIIWHFLKINQFVVHIGQQIAGFLKKILKQLFHASKVAHF